MEQLLELYNQMGISPAVYEYGENTIAELSERFNAIDKVAEYNQAKVLSAMQKNRVSAACFAATTGYGYDDVGRDNLEKVDHLRHTRTDSRTLRKFTPRGRAVIPGRYPLRYTPGGYWNPGKSMLPKGIWCYLSSSRFTY